jgi:2-polyprenyl-3-methyl-5-hydroxy-6-metoxy-1,4-benzoquinol methylase
MSTLVSASDQLLADGGELVEVSRCPLCQFDRYAVALSEPPYEVRRCRDCGLGWVSPRLSEAGLAAMYGDDSYWRSESPKTLGYGDYRGAERLYIKTFKRRLEFVLGDRERGGRALDVGCAAGFCMAAMGELGFEAYGVEVSAEIARHAQEALGFGTVHVGTLETAPHELASFDLITMWDVVEHVVDPLSLLRRARELLKPDGLLVLETQNIDSAFARLLGRRWHHFKHQEHIYHFTPATVRQLLDMTGFEVQKVTPRSGGKYVPFEFIAERAERVHPALSRAVRPLTRFESAAIYLNFRDEMVVTAVPASTS